ncbi:hypothetical protein AAFF_G00068200 [Aldrovandia affinis]|uniref:exodeoxyribonuclease III n=1 Tax=Aldrovandia affinis TaxID=143900 RepID=A0AAD7RZ93_9TELE|nr:hypothetical protein AAFF_G00068200 [Aldrovandia affinis]
MDLCSYSTVSGSRPDHCSLVFFDLETTGLGRACDIIQLSAVSGGHSLNLYTVPRCRVQRGASAVTGFRVWRHRLYLHHRPVPTITLPEALTSFLAFLRMLGQPLLVGHNVRRFDCPVLARALDEFQLRAAFLRVTSGFLDTLPLARDLLRGRGQQSYRQESLVRDVLGVSYPAHDALEDVRALQRLYGAFQPTPEQAQRHTFTLASMAAPASKQPPVKTRALCRQPGQHPLWEQPGKAAEPSPESTGGAMGPSSVSLRASRLSGGEMDEGLVVCQESARRPAAADGHSLSHGTWFT